MPGELHQPLGPRSKHGGIPGPKRGGCAASLTSYVASYGPLLSGRVAKCRAGIITPSALLRSDLCLPYPGLTVEQKQYSYRSTVLVGHTTRVETQYYVASLLKVV